MPLNAGGDGRKYGMKHKELKEFGRRQCGSGLTKLHARLGAPIRVVERRSR
jgi:hypothetical protein